MLLERERNLGLGMDAPMTVCSWNTSGSIWLVHACSGHRMLLEHERKYRMLLDHQRNYGLGMDAWMTVCSWNTYGI